MATKKKADLKLVGRGGIKVPEPEMIALGDINEAAYNPRIMPPEMMRALKASLRRHGMVVNLVVQRRGMVLVGGHQRLQALREAAAEDGVDAPGRLPCVVLDLSDAEAKQLNVALNKIDGEFDPYRLGAVFASMRDELTAPDVEAMGFEMAEIDEAVRLALPVDEQISALEDEVGGELGAFARSITLTVDFETVEQRDAAKTVLSELAERSGARPGKLLTQALKAWSVAHPAKGGGKKKRSAA